MPIFWRVFIINVVEFCWKLFLHLLRWSYGFCSSIFLLWCITLIDLQILNHPCILGINPTWSWCMILLMYCWIWFANIYLKIFLPVCSSLILTCNFLFCDIFFWFWYQGNPGNVKWVWKLSFLGNFLE